MTGFTFGKYTPGIIPKDADQLSIALQDELNKIASSLSGLVADYIILEELHAEPAKIYDGMIVRADGSDWHPYVGAARGIYMYDANKSGGAGWVQVKATP